MANMYLNELTEFPSIAVRNIGENKMIAALLLDNPDVEVGSEEADSIFDKYIFDYDYVDLACQESAAFICIEAEMPSVGSPTIKDMNLYVTIRCHKNFMKLDKSKFKGIYGNRKDNLARYIDGILNGSDLFGIGKLELRSARTIASPPGFSTRELAYTVPTFKA